ncbi:CBS domain-containing protein [Streptomyces sp. NPDC085612]|uniref:CBS domain-containing protein n=1 Tax=Streptomyces sp. NPDC085612 TaxID=3365732 RepID=UPI0037CD528B
MVDLIAQAGDGAQRTSGSRVSSAGVLVREEEAMATAREIMHHGATRVREGETLMDAARRMSELGDWGWDHSRSANRMTWLHGIITDRDIVVKCLARGKDPHRMTAGMLSQGKPYTVAADADTGQVLHIMREHRVRRLPAIEDHRLVGMISEADLALHLTEEMSRSTQVSASSGIR